MSNIFNNYALLVTSAISLSSTAFGIQLPLSLSFSSSYNIFEKNETLQELKEKLQLKLLKLPYKIIIVIDDIDRLNDTEIRQLFQLVKSLGDFNNTIYLLAFDNKIVSKALDKTQDGAGQKYLEKIIQVQFNVPLASKSVIKSILLGRLRQVININSDIELPRFFEVEYDFYNMGLNLFIRNIRDINRLMNTFSFTFPLVKEEVDHRDFIAISILQVFVPNIYNSIKENRDRLLVKDSKDFIEKMINSEYPSTNLNIDKDNLISLLNQCLTAPTHQNENLINQEGFALINILIYFFVYN